MNQKHYYSIDLLKIIACFLVIINHTYLWNQNTLIKSIELSLCRIAVPIFIICTGFLTAKQDISLKKTLQKTSKIVILLLIFSFIIYFLQTKSLNLINFFYIILQNPIIEPYWYLYMIIGLYLIQPFINKLCHNLNLSSYIYLIIIILILPNILKISPYFYLTNFSYIIGYYIMGAFFQKLLNEYPKFPYVILFLIYLILSTCTIIYTYNNPTFTFSIDHIIIILSTFCFTLSILSLEDKIKSHKFLNTLSSLTLFTYLLHPILQNKIINIISNLPLTNIPIVLLSQISTLIICFIITYLLKKIPYLNKFI